MELLDCDDKIGASFSADMNVLIMCLPSINFGSVSPSAMLD